MMLKQARQWMADRAWHLTVTVLAFSISLGLSVLFDPDRGTSFPINLGACLALGFVVWPLSFALSLGGGTPVLFFPLALSYWPLLAYTGHNFVQRKRWSFAFPVVLLLVTPAISMGRMFAAMMSA